MLQDHRDELRVLWRADGLGRFLLREAHSSPPKQDEQGQLAMSLSRRYQGLLVRLAEGARLRATVVPRQQPGCVTVTLLELLQQHFDRGNAPIAKQFDVQFQDGSTGSARFYPAVVTSDPNHSGYVDVEFIVRDSALGLVHGSAFATGEDRRAPAVGSPVWFRLSSEPAKLSLRDVELEPVRVLVEREASLKLPPAGADVEELDGAGADVGPESATEEGPARGGLDSVLLSRRPVPQHVARALLELSDDPEWPYRVWRFWAQSRYLRTDLNDPCRPGEAADAMEVAAELRREVPPAPDLTLEEARARFAVGGAVAMTVTGVAPDGARAWLAAPDGTRAMVLRNSVGRRGIKDLNSVLRPGDSVTAVVAEVGEYRERIQLRVELRGLEGGDEQGMSLEEAQRRYPAGAHVQATVRSVADDKRRAWLTLDDGTHATVAQQDVGSGPLLRISLALSVGTAVLARVERVAERRGEIQVEVSLRSVAVPSLKDQLAAIGMRIGDTIDGSVASVNEQLGLFIELVPGMGNGLAHRSTLPPGWAAAFSPGDNVRVQLLDAVENPRRPGAVNINLRYVSR
jgi:predicted RNA-binding protein with RPS1 domain